MVGLTTYIDFLFLFFISLDQLPNLVHMHNQNDVVPTVPPHSSPFDYVHASGEAFVEPSGDHTVVECPGQENENCSFGNSVLDASLDDHKGPYVGLMYV